jgi:arylsulfatase A-like enzyme
MLSAAGYDVVYKGKWHLSHPANGHCWTEADIEHMRVTYGMTGWNPPDAGSTAFASGPEDFASIATLGGGHPDNDGRFVQGITPGCECGPLEEEPPAAPHPPGLQFIPKAQCQAPPSPGKGCQTRGFGESVLEYLGRAGKDGKPFCLVVSLVNPHDLVFYPKGYSYPAVGYDAAVPDEGISLPANLNDPLTEKPEVQSAYRKAIGTESWDADRQRGYVNFYANLHKVVDRHIQTVLDGLERHGLTRDTIVFRTADHGELGLSHGLLEKAYCVYEEGLHVPLIVSNPKLFPQGRETSAIWSHVDLAATLASLAGADRIGVGVDQTPVLKGEKPSARDAALFAFDDIFPAGIALTAPASHIRALRTERYTYAVYFTATYAGKPGGSAISAGPPFAYELYDHELDPLQLVNLAYQPDPATRGVWESLHARLTAELDATGSRPPGWPGEISSTA